MVAQRDAYAAEARRCEGWRAGRIAVPLRVASPRGREGKFPGYLDPQLSRYRHTALAPTILRDTGQKIDFTFATSMRTLFCNPRVMLLFVHRYKFAKSDVY